MRAGKGEEEEEDGANELTEDGDDVATDGERKHLDASGKGVGDVVVGSAAVGVVGSHGEGRCGYVEECLWCFESVEVMLTVVGATQQ